VWIFRASERGSFVGRCRLRRGLIDGVEETEVMWAVMADHWRCGFGAEMARGAVDAAFSQTDLGDLAAFTLPENAASRRVMEKSGFAVE
jgi:RimJ/RimL family protein N-acetyltransferase